MTLQDASIATSIDLPSYLLGTVMLLLVMVFHGLVLLQISKRHMEKFNISSEIIDRFK
jgi:hypothetical protein